MSQLITTRELSVLVEEEDGRKVVVVDGEIDLATAPRFEAFLVGVIALRRGDVILDMSSVDFMDSTGIGVLVRAELSLLGSDGRLVLRSPSPAVARVLAVAGKLPHFAIEG
jgi:anti-sigma B factor antagonist